jgi:hypothetical protein
MNKNEAKLNFKNQKKDLNLERKQKTVVDFCLQNPIGLVNSVNNNNVKQQKG